MARSQREAASVALHYTETPFFCQTSWPEVLEGEWAPQSEVEQVFLSSETLLWEMPLQHNGGLIHASGLRRKSSSHKITATVKIDKRRRFAFIATRGKA